MRLRFLKFFYIFIWFLFFSCQSTYIPENDFSVHYKYSNNLYNQKLLDAVKNCDLDNARICLEKNADPAVHDILNQTALMYACWNSDFPMVRLLCEYKKDNVSWFRRIFRTYPEVNELSKYYYSALFCAAYRGSYDILAYLVSEMNAKLIEVNEVIDPSSGKIIKNVSIFKDSNGENILHKLAKSKSSINAERFIKEFSIYNGVPIWDYMIYEKDKNGYTPFHYAVISGDIGMVKLLLSMDTSKAVLNMPAGDRYPLYTSYQIRNLNIFKFLLEQPETVIDNPIPNKVSNSEPIKMSLQTFVSQSSTDYIQSKQFKPDFFIQMYENRLLWENSGRLGTLIVEPNELKLFKDEFYFAIQDPTVKLDDLKILHKRLGRNLYDIGYDKEKDLLQVAIDTERNDSERLAVLKFLLENGVKSRNLTDETQLLYYALMQANIKREEIYLNVAKYLIKNHNQFVESYSLTLPSNNTPWMQILSGDYVRNSLSFLELKEILDIINRSFDFRNDREHVFEYVLYNNHGDLEYTNELFDYFFYLLDDTLYVYSDIPIIIWLYQNNFRYGVKRILENPIVSDKINLKNDYYYAKNIKFKDLLISNNDTEFLDMYYNLYPNEKLSDGIEQK